MRVQPLIDADVLVYEVGFGVQSGWDNPDPPPFEMARELLENRINNICAFVNATEPPKLFLTGSSNFRETLATILPYKGNRNQPKPYHYKNIRAYLMGMYDTIVVEGFEADDAMCIEQTKAFNSDVMTIICSRDKDVRQCKGWHYSWELGNQPSFGPEYCDTYGWIKLSDTGKKITGMGDKFFLAQCLMGDRVDNIQGVPKYGPVKAFELLGNTSTYPEGLSLVREAYKGFYGDNYEAALLENGQLLWMIKEIKEDKPVMWDLDYVPTVN